MAVSKAHLVESDSVISGNLIHDLTPVGFYKYLGQVLLNSRKWKTFLATEYKHHFRKFPHTKLYSKHLISAINSHAISLLCSSGGIINWSQAELHKLDIDTRKLLTMHGGFSMNSDVDHVYISRKNRGQGLTSVMFAIEHEQRNSYNKESSLIAACS